MGISNCKVSLNLVTQIAVNKFGCSIASTAKKLAFFIPHEPKLSLPEMLAALISSQPIGENQWG